MLPLQPENNADSKGAVERDFANETDVARQRRQSLTRLFHGKLDRLARGPLAADQEKA